LKPANSSKAIFITGTDTGVGKTFFAAALTRLLTRQGLRVGVMKPVESGVEDVEMLGADGDLLSWAAVNDQPTDLVSPYRLHAPVAPSVAASHEGVKIIPSVIQDAFDSLCKQHDYVIVEGAGGLMTPLAGGFLVADLIQMLQLQALFVCRPNLGTINHTMLSLFTAQQLGINTAGYIINGMPDEPDMAEEKAPHSLASLATAELLGVTPHISNKDQHQAVELLADAIQALPTYKKLLTLIGLADLAEEK
jgi:dethiobiotin synthetase